MQSANVGLTVWNLTENGLTCVKIDESQTNSRSYAARFTHGADDLLRFHSDGRNCGTGASRIFVGAEL
jgi:hypothetical protein